MKRDIECWQQQQFNLLKLSRYRLIRADRVPWYLQRGRNISIIARFRCETEEWGMNSWRKERKCRICGMEEETVNHTKVNCCPDMRTFEQLMDEKGSGENWMRSFLAKRENIVKCNHMRLIGPRSVNKLNYYYKLIGLVGCNLLLGEEPARL